MQRHCAGMPETPGGGGRIICACRTQVRKWGSTVQKNNVSRVYVERKQEFAGEAARLCQELRDNLGLEGLTGVRILTRYDIEGLPESVYREAGRVVLAEPAVDLVYEEEDFAREIARSEMAGSEERVLAIEYQPGQYDQRGDYTAQCLQVLTRGERPTVRVAKVLVLTRKNQRGRDGEDQKYLINPLESREAPWKNRRPWRKSFRQQRRLRLSPALLTPVRKTWKESGARWIWRCPGRAWNFASSTSGIPPAGTRPLLNCGFWILTGPTTAGT